MIDVSELMTDLDFAANYKVTRKNKKWDKGCISSSESTTMNYYGPVQPASTKDLEQIPELDRTKMIMKFLCAPPDLLFIGDEIEYNGEVYKIIKVSPWGANGYIRAFGVDKHG